jgi:hypothetical protein
VESFEPDKALSVNHETFLVVTHPVLEVILNVAVLLTPAFIVNDDGETDKFGTSCVIVTVSLIAGRNIREGDIITVAVRAVVPVLAVITVKVIVPFFEPDIVLTSNHDVALLTTRHDVFEVTVNVAVLLIPAFMVNADGETDKIGATCVTVTV